MLRTFTRATHGVHIRAAGGVGGNAFRSPCVHIDIARQWSRPHLSHIFGGSPMSMAEATVRTADTSAPLLPALAERWSPRSFDPAAPVDEDKLRAALEAARWSPSANNTQPWRFIVARRGSEAFEKVVA